MESRDPRFNVEHGGGTEYSLVTRSSDGQMTFLANLAGLTGAPEVTA